MPATLIGYVVAEKLAGAPGARLLLLTASVFFYCWWEIILSNSVHVFSSKLRVWSALGFCPEFDLIANRLIATGIFLNLAGLAYFKYIGFFTLVWNDAIGANEKSPWLCFRLESPFSLSTR